MAKVFVIGATGGVGRRLCPMLVSAGHQVTGMCRSPEQVEELINRGVEPIEADLMDLTADQLTAMTVGQEVLVFSAGAAGSGLNRTAEIDGEGPLKLIEAARQNGIRRLYLVSAMPEAGRGQEPSEGFEFYMRTKKQADAALAASGLDWVILRPGTLLHEDCDDGVCLSQALVYGNVKRGNVAAVLAELINTPTIRREILELTDGSQPVRQAVEAVAHYR
ncbi:SDR family oxidoreductase [Oceanobacter mangrovi]|uniref:SDR family oxidoreductase n=1 Tax=Oceanobacter mangrovi TaxID=2862510 RepID=UPI001C8DB679|nr:SDR family oxidoreductase [Oceanobacter mangrovi]